MVTASGNFEKMPKIVLHVINMLRLLKLSLLAKLFIVFANFLLQGPPCYIILRKIQYNHIVNFNKIIFQPGGEILSINFYNVSTPVGRSFVHLEWADNIG